MVMLAAHSVNGTGVRHALDAHLRGTAALAREFAEHFGAGDLAAYLGLVHDIGKAECAWQARLAAVEAAGGRVGIDHKMAGTWLASRSVGVFAAAVSGHHGGLPGGAALKNNLRAADAGRQAGWAAAIEKVAALIPEVRSAEPHPLPVCLDGKDSRDPLVTDLLMRMVFSALVDADFLDTEAHFRGFARPRCQLAGDLTGRYERQRAALLAGADWSPVDELRQKVYSQAVAAAAGPVGMYRLPARPGRARRWPRAGSPCTMPGLTGYTGLSWRFRSSRSRSRTQMYIAGYWTGGGSRLWCLSTTAEWTSTARLVAGRPVGGAGSRRRTGMRRSW